MNDWQPLVDLLNAACITISACFGIARVALVFKPTFMQGHVLKSYTALAHVWVGMLIGGWLVRMDAQGDELPWMLGRNALVISLVELACFIVSIFWKGLK